MPTLEPMLRYAITDRTRFNGDEPARQAALLAQAERLAAAGIDFLQLREHDLPAADLASLARKLLATLRAHNPAPRLLINSRADVALATCADGVHLTSAPGQLTPAQVRALYAAASLPEPIVSLSCHTLDEVTRAASASPDDRPTHILFGPVFEKVIAESHPTQKAIANKKISAGTGLDLLLTACLAAAPIPVLALGGITPSNATSTLTAGAAGVAAIRLFLSESAQIPHQSAH
ncbi:MAG TPA: thiamine phosphate synthase [Acidobacteriaceae bacterium]|nr:thiamine phosphate synthase [Acidobacteriaceae bacterium]